MWGERLIRYQFHTHKVRNAELYGEDNEHHLRRLDDNDDKIHDTS